MTLSNPREIPMNRFVSLYLSISCAAFAAAYLPPSQAEAAGAVRAGEFVAGPNGLAGRTAGASTGNHGAAAGRRGLAADGQGNVAGASSGRFVTDNGAQGSRARTFNRSSDGAVDASGSASASGANGSASRSGTYERKADGSASGTRSTTATNANTGNTVEATTTYTKGEGVSRSASCKDAAGNAATCGSR